MGLFEFEDGRLIPAQFGHPVASGFSSDVMDAVCAQVLEIVARPLFPITWRDMVHGREDQDIASRLTALDATGQVVSVEVIARLDSEILINSLSRLAQTAALSWTDLAAEYPGGPQGFKAGWVAFHDSMPPSRGAGPRLVMVVGEIDPQVRPALDVLANSGVEVHEVTLRQMSNGRVFLDVVPVGPRLYGHSPQLLVGGQSNGVLEIPAVDVSEAQPQHIESVTPEPDQAEQSEESGELEEINESEDDEESEEDVEARVLREVGVPLLGHDRAGLKTLAQIVGEDVPLVAPPDCGAPEPLSLTSEGILRSAGLSWTDLAALELDAPALGDAWEHLHIADLLGPSLAEAVAEINGEMIREYESAEANGAARYNH